MDKNPEGLSLAISMDKDSYRFGETIVVTLTFSNNSGTEYYAETSTYDRSGRLRDLAFHVDSPLGGYADPLETHQSGIGGGLRKGPERLGQYSQTFTLNEWVRFDEPGDYRIYCTTNRVWSTTDDVRQIVNLCSQIIKVRIIPASKASIAETVTDALKALQSKDSKVRRHSIRLLRFLSTKKSVEALIPFLGGEDHQLYFNAYAGIIGSPDWAHARKALQSGLGDPDVAVNSHYIRTLVHVSLARHEHLITWDPNNAEVSRQRKKDLAARKKAIKKKILEHLANVYENKQSRALAMTCSFLAEEETQPPGLRQRLAASFLHLTEDEQESLLKHRWEQIRCKELESVVRSIVQGGPKHKEWRSPGIFSRALLRYKEFEADKARAVILNDIKQARPMLANEVLLSLPDESLPEMEEILVQNLLALRETSPFKAPLLIERYATARILPKVIEFYQENKGRWACSVQNSLLRYWVKHDRRNGLTAVVEAVGFRNRKHTRCYTSVLYHVLSAHYGPDAEEIALSFLDDEEPDLVINVVRLLGHNGSVGCVDRLLRKLTSVDPGKKERPAGALFSEADVYRGIVMCFLNNDRWQLSDDQEELLKKHLRTDGQKQMYYHRFGPEQKGE
jgi:HEAT repeat protein